MRPKNIIFFDGQCGLCHRFVRFVLKYDKKEIFSFSPLQGEAISVYLNAAQRAELPDSIILIDTDGLLYAKSFAVVKVLSQMELFWRALAQIIKMFPPSFSNRIYDLVAQKRQKLFKKPNETCPLVDEKYKGRFLS